MATITSKSRQFLLLALVLNGAALVLSGFLFLQVKASSERTSALSNNIELQAKQENTLHSIKTLVAQTASVREQLEAYFISKEGVVSFIELLEGVGQSAGAAVSIQNVEETPLDGSDVLESLRVSITAEGSWESVVHFLGLLEYLPYESSVGDVVFSRSDSAWRLDARVHALKVI